MALPFLPGQVFNPTLGKAKYHKSHHFDYANDVPLMVGEEKPGIGGDHLPGQKLKPRQSAIPRGKGQDQPSWVAFDRQVLCFDAYFQEAVHEKREEQFRVRKCKIYFYLEDDSVQVIEPRGKNAGVPQGTLIRRHRIQRPAPDDGEFYTVEDFNVGGELSMYARHFKIVDCDQFSRNFLKKLGVKVPDPLHVPGDPYVDHRKAMDESMQPLRPYEKHDTLKQFLDHDRHVLRFFCYWNDTDSMFGDPRQMILHYFLADDTMEIREVIPQNAGRDATPMFLRRGKIPKNVASLKQPGTHTDRTVLNVFGPMGQGGRYILDSLKTGAQSLDFYSDADLTIGSVVNVWGRKFLVCDCDEFTKEYYKTKYGVSNMQPIDFPQESESARPREMPPYNGFGSEEDSLCSCLSLLPKPPKRDFLKFMEKDRAGLDSNVLRFLARMDTQKPTDIDRRFIISYFLSDDSILVFEPPVRNSGIIGGKFLERGRVRKPDQPLYSTRLSDYYCPQDFFVGIQVEFNKYRFILMDADEYAYNYMERHAAEFAQANIDLVLSKLRQTVNLNKDQLGRALMGGTLNYEAFRSRILQLTQGLLSEHEIITLGRHYQERKNDDGYSLETLAAIAQEHLRKAHFENFAKIIEQCIHHDSERIGQLPVEVVRSVCTALKVPLPDDLLRSLLARCTSGAGTLNYSEFVNRINWEDHPAPSFPTSRPGNNTNEVWQEPRPENLLTQINMDAFMKDMGITAPISSTITSPQPPH